jgi:hypothetical protein
MIVKAALRLCIVTLATLTLVGTTSVEGQSWDGRGWRRAPPRFPDAATLADRRFIFCRVLYTSVRSEWLGQGWATDYPDADANFMRRFAEFTKVHVSIDGEGRANHVVVELTDDALFSFPFIFMSDIGTMGLTEEEAARLRAYLLKGGFLFVDDFWGWRAWENWEREIAKVLPPEEYPIFDIPPEHPVLHALYDVYRIPQIPSIQYWRRSGGGDTSERGAESAIPHLRGIEDRYGRLMVIMSHNTDIADGWERENEEYEFFHRFSPDAYALGINIVLYALTH